MPLPVFITELGREEFRPRLRMSIWTGFLVALGFAMLALMGQLLGALPWTATPYVLVLVKLATVGLAWLALRHRQGLGPAMAMNVFASCAMMTAAVYITGGLLSPLFSIYLIEIAVIALLTNAGTTVVVTLLCGSMYAGMAIAVQTGVLPTTEPPIVHAGAVTTGYLVARLSVAAFVLGITTIFINNTVRLLRSKEEALENKTRQLMRASKQKTEFMANVTHELRTPIHGIMGLTELMSEQLYGPMNRKQIEACENIRRSATAQLQLIDELLLLSRSEAGKLTYKESPADLAKLLPGVVSSIRWMLAGKELTVETSIDPRLPTIRVDRGKLNHVLLNLLGNAAKFTPEGGHVEIRAFPVGEDRICIEVEDTGVGIPANDIENIFDEFHQVDGSDEREWGGVGLGLSIVTRLTRMMQGEVTVRSKVDSGTTFSITLPIDGLSGRVVARTRERSKPFPGVAPATERN